MGSFVGMPAFFIYGQMKAQRGETYLNLLLSEIFSNRRESFSRPRASKRAKRSFLLSADIPLPRCALATSPPFILPRACAVTVFPGKDTSSGQLLIMIPC